MVDCVSISTNHLFGDNPIYEQNRLSMNASYEGSHGMLLPSGTWNTINTTIQPHVTSFGGIRLSLIEVREAIRSLRESVTVSRATLEKVRGKTGIRKTVLNYGEDIEYRRTA